MKSPAPSRSPVDNNFTQRVAAEARSLFDTYHRQMGIDVRIEEQPQDVHAAWYKLAESVVYSQIVTETRLASFKVKADALAGALHSSLFTIQMLTTSLQDSAMGSPITEQALDQLKQIAASNEQVGTGAMAIYSVADAQM